MRILFTFCLFISFYGSIAAAEPQLTSLDRYVTKPDDRFHWQKRREGQLGSTRYIELTLTSQTWRGIAWKHQLFLLKPSSLIGQGRHALLFITGGSWHESLERPGGSSELPRDAQRFALLAEQAQTPVAVLLHVPHQPILGGKYEDEIIAYTFAQFLRTRDAEWPLLLPMAKSAVRAMDAAQAVAQEDWELAIERFTVTGASKRGWTTWLTAAVDPRVQALAPMVIDMLNMHSQMKHQVVSWGDYSYKIDDYTELGLQDYMDTPAGTALRAIVDPYSYRERLVQPKLIILGTNDHYWPLDAANLYWNELPEPKHLLYIPNNGHGLTDLGRLIGTLSAFHRNAAMKQSLPQLRWDFTQEAKRCTLRMHSDQPPKEVRLWTATATTRDFREARWQSQKAAAVPQKEGHYQASVALPTEGFAALFGEFIFDGESAPFYLSTNVQIIGPAQEAE